MTAEERIAQLELELAQERAKTARVEAENTSLRQQMEHILPSYTRWKGGWPRIATTVASRPRVIAQDVSGRASASGAGSKREDSPGMLAGP